MHTTLPPGAPLPRAPTGSSPPTRLWERALAHDLGGGAQVVPAFEPAGMKATLRFSTRPIAAPAMA
jgi:hypothetical protein